jgi:RNA polymerase sigma-70 factor (ECF subfamily)
VIAPARPHPTAPRPGAAAGRVSGARLASGRLAAERALPGERVIPFREAGRRRAERVDLSLAARSDEDLVRAARNDPGRAGEPLDELFGRYRTRVAAWCARVSGRREEAADLAQEVFLRVYERLDQFRFESSFATWLYLVTRSVAINRSIANRRRDADSIDEEGFAEPADSAPAIDDELARTERVARLRAAIGSELEPLEAKVLHLHFIDEMPLAGIDRLLDLANKSGSKAYIVSAKRKLKRHFAAEHHGERGRIRQ